MKKYLTAVTLFIVCISIYGQAKLSFNNNKDFKIVQFTDVHYRPGKIASDTAIILIEEVLKAEKPDLVIFTGDLAWGKPAKTCFDEVLKPVINQKIPWAFVFGNHDDEQEWTRKQIMDYLVQQPYCYAQHGDKYLKGESNYTLEINQSEKDSTALLLYFMDSGSYNNSVSGVGKSYDWFSLDQINWYSQQSAAYTKENNNQPYPALAFFHIPLFEYAVMTAQENKGGIIGHKNEKECNAKLNTGMFAAMAQAKDVMGTFVGHDHDNDYIGLYNGIALAYGRYSGGNTVYNNLGLNGCRVINLKENQKGFDTYIRLLGGEIIYPVKFPSDFK